MTQVLTLFDCKHELSVDVSVDADVIIPEHAVRGLGKCPDCAGQENMIAISGVAPGSKGELELDSILMMPID